LKLEVVAADSMSCSCGNLFRCSTILWLIFFVKYLVENINHLHHHRQHRHRPLKVALVHVNVSMGHVLWLLLGLH